MLQAPNAPARTTVGANAFQFTHGTVHPDELSTSVSPKRREMHLEPLKLAMAEFSIDTQRCVVALLAQIDHESDELPWMRELRGRTR